VFSPEVVLVLAFAGAAIGFLSGLLGSHSKLRGFGPSRE
jgi:hypothetical protein